MSVPPIICVVGPAGCGKTTLIGGVIPLLQKAGLRVGAVKHAMHMDNPHVGRDFDQFARCGADPAIVAARQGQVIVGYKREMPLPDLAEIYCGGCDIVIAEGYRHADHDKIAIVNGASGEPQGEFTRLKVGADSSCDFRTKDFAAIAKWIISWLDRRRELRAGLTGVILAGGASKRMGMDKTQTIINRHSVMAKMSVMLCDWLGRAMIVGKHSDECDIPRCTQWHLDLFGQIGPLGGIATALKVLSVTEESPDGVLVLPCDMPAFNVELLELLLAGRDKSASATYLAHPNNGKGEALAAIYEQSSLASIVDAIADGRTSSSQWMTSAKSHRVEVPAHLSDRLANFNTPAELAAILKRFPEI